MPRNDYRSIYGNLTTIKNQSLLPLQAGITADDDELWALILLASEQVDLIANRHFFPQTEARYFDGEAKPRILVDDLISITSLKEDENGDGTFETTWDSGNYHLSPYNHNPTTRGGQPYTELVLSHTTTRAFAAGIRRYEITGVWGYSEQLLSSGETINDAGGISDSDTSVTVSDGGSFAEGQTIKIDSELMLITSISTNTLTITRGLNGTTAATHADSTAIDILTYPGPVEHATMLMAAELFQTPPELEPFRSKVDVAEIADRLLSPYKRLH